MQTEIVVADYDKEVWGFLFLELNDHHIRVYKSWKAYYIILGDKLLVKEEIKKAISL